MRKTKIFTIITYPLVLLLFYAVYNSINSKMEEDRYIKRSEAAVIERLKMIRDAEKAYMAFNGRYTANADTLVHFLKNGIIYNVSKREIITKRDKEDPDYYTKGSEKVVIQADTLGSENALDKLFPKSKYPDFDVNTIGQNPVFPDKKFEFFTDTVRKQTTVLVHVLEVVDTSPVDKTRKEDSENRKRKFLRFGSRTETTLTGNWED